MSIARSFIAILICQILALPGFAQTYAITGERHGGFLDWFADDYRAHPISSTSFEDSRASISSCAPVTFIYPCAMPSRWPSKTISISKTPATPPNSPRPNLLRADAGQLLRNISSSISSGPNSAQVGVLASNALGSGGTGSSSTASGTGGVLSGLNVQLAGTAIPNLDPAFYAQGQYVHNTTIETATNITGTNFLVTQYKSAIYGVQQGFLTGTNVQLYMTDQLGVWRIRPTTCSVPTARALLP